MCWETVKYQGKSELVKARFNFLIVVRKVYILEKIYRNRN